MDTLRIVPISVLSDNYAWVISSPRSNTVVVVDPGESKPVQLHLERTGRNLSGILLTHHHADHVGGVEDLKRRYHCPVHGPDIGAVVDTVVNHGDHLTLDDPPMDLRVLGVPGHTLDHLAYVGDGFILSGDTLFAGGCGRLFEGTAVMMQASLDRLADHPGGTQIYCAHEYTEANLRFARAVEPENQDIALRLERVRAARREGNPTIPSTLTEELKTNPFLRSRHESVIQAAARHAGFSPSPGAETLAVIRSWKDGFL